MNVPGCPAICLVSYITFGIPVILAGVLLNTVGVTAIALTFGDGTVAAAATGTTAQIATARRTGPTTQLNGRRRVGPDHRRRHAPAPSQRLPADRQPALPFSLSLEADLKRKLSHGFPDNLRIFERAGLRSFRSVSSRMPARSSWTGRAIESWSSRQSAVTSST